jgi:hypothetical protein
MKPFILLAHEFTVRWPMVSSGRHAGGRAAIFAQGNDVEWATPVLYLRAGDAAISDRTL